MRQIDFGTVNLRTDKLVRMRELRVFSGQFIFMRLLFFDKDA